ncbi:hypothetical protein [uncultured Prevotella sp.]|uniref:hypothetical protein n=1 Tax=uncultured Prevotella sp. TaxID=159272 RepID=UPI00260A62F7|nr:hypothetical protein [uncultured Prevotella sp.]
MTLERFLVDGFVTKYGPPIIGWLSELSNLRIALSLAACFGLFIAFVAGKVGKRIR